MKRVWMIVSTMAIANIIAIGGLLVWLQTTDRLSKHRIQTIRAMLSVTQAQEEQARVLAEAEVVEAKKNAAEEARRAVPPETAAERIAEKQLGSEKELQFVLRQRQEIENLRQGLFRQLADLERREKALADARSAFASEQQRIAEMEGTQQFKIALSALENQKPKDAKAVLQAMLESRNVDQVVGYLAKMDESKRSKVLAEFVKGEPAVAADLLERLRTRGLAPQSDAATLGRSASPPLSAADEPGLRPSP